MDMSILKRTGPIMTALLLFASTAFAQQSELPAEPKNWPKTSLHFIPSNATGFVYFDVVEILNTPGMKLPREIFSGVATEANIEFERHLGLRLADMVDATLVFPDFETMQGGFGGKSPVFALFAFSSPVQRKLIEKTLPADWKITKTEGRKIYVNDSLGLTLFLSSPNTFALGSEEGVRWFYKNRKNHSDSGVRPLTKQLGDGQITAAFNTDSIPKELKAFAPPEFQSISNAKTIVASIDVTDGIAVDAKMKFLSSDDAAAATRIANTKLQEGVLLLKEMETVKISELKAGTPSLMMAVEPLSALAMTRYGQKLLGQATLDQSNDELVASISVEGFNGQMVMITCLTAIQSIGTASQEKFQQISNELDAESGRSFRK